MRAGVVGDLEAEFFDENTVLATITGSFEMGGGWYLLLSLRTFEHRTQICGAAIEYFGSDYEATIDDVLDDRCLRGVELTQEPIARFQYRWMREIGSQYERSLWDVATGAHRRQTGAGPHGFDWIFGEKARSHRASRPPEFYAEIARAFVELDGSEIRLAERLGEPQGTVHGWIKRATQDGYLNKPGRGVRGARHLTPLAMEILNGIR